MRAKKMKRRYTKTLLRAKLTIHGLPDFTDGQKGEVIGWLKNQILVVKENKEYAKTYTARLFK